MAVTIGGGGEVMFWLRHRQPPTTLFLSLLRRTTRTQSSHILTPSLFFLYRTDFFGLIKKPFDFAHKPRGWIIQLGFEYKNYQYTLEINGVKFDDMSEAPPRERAALARSAILYQMEGPMK